MADSTFDNIYVNNNVGIGTTEPASRLHILSPIGISNKVFLENIGGSLLKISTETSSASIGTENAFPLSIQTDGITRISINSTGSVAITGPLSVQNTLTVTGNANIGTDTTSANLQVKGNVTANAFSGNGTSLSGLVKQAGDTMTGPLTVQANLSVSSNVGIGTTEPKRKLHIQGASSADFINDIHDRPGLAITGNYPELDLVSGVNNPNHGPTIRLGAYNDDAKNAFKHWVIGTAGRNASFLDIGFSANNDPNPHSGIRNYNGTTVLTLLENGNAGIGTTNPQAKLEVAGAIHAGSIKADGALAGIWSDQPLTPASISASGSWQNVSDTSINFKLDRDAIVFFTYSINVQPEGNPGGDWLGTRLVVDGKPHRSSGSHYQAWTSADSNVNLNGNLVLSLASGDHTVALQWFKNGTTVGSWSSNPSWDDGYIGGRTLVVMAFYQSRPIFIPIPRLPS